MKAIKFSLMAVLATISLVSCSEDEPARMLWEVSGTPESAGKVTYDPNAYQQIRVDATSAAYEATLTCTNYKEVYFNETAGATGDYINEKGHFTVSKAAPNTIKVSFDATDNLTEEINEVIYIRAKDDKNEVSNALVITRK